MFMVAVDWRPWWHSRHRLASTGFRLPLSSFSVLKVTLFPLGKGTPVTARRVNFAGSSWQVLHARPFEGSVSTTPVVRTVPRGPRFVRNYYQRSDLWGGHTLSAERNFTGVLENRPVPGDNHLTIDKDPALHREVIAMLGALRPDAAPPARPGGARPAA